MGVERSDWIVIGADVGYNEAKGRWEEFESLLSQDTPGELTYLIDGMGGEYFVVGIVIEADTDGYNGLGITKINPEKTFENERKIVRDHIREVFGKEVAPQIIVLTHWT